MMAKLSDVAVALQLEAEAAPDRPDITIIHRKAGTSRFRAAVGEEWRRGRLLGEGGYGQVYLEECIGGGNLGHVRAVKRLQKARNENYHHELNALALFSLGKVRCDRSLNAHLTSCEV
jgi:calcium/calmodulin-dependent protein kinase I